MLSASVRPPVSQADAPERPEGREGAFGFAPLAETASESSITAHFESAAGRFASRLAVQSARSDWTYRELNREANRVAHLLLAQELPPGVPVALLLQKDAPLLAAMLGVLKAGHFYVVIDPLHPVERNRLILEDSGASLVLADDASLAASGELAKRRPLVHVREAAGRAEENPVRQPQDPDSLSALVYTSGSTGRPKGVMHSHGFTLDWCQHHAKTVQISPHDRLSLLYSCSVVGALRDVFGALLQGASVHPFDVAAEGFERLAAWLEQEQITIYHSIPSVLRHFAGHTAPEQRFPRVRAVIFGGERVRSSDAALVWRCFSPQTVLYTGLGASETGTVCGGLVTAETPLDGDFLPLGRPVAGREVRLVDAQDVPVGPGETGEIVVSSRFLSQGYWRNAELTRQRFPRDLPGGPADGRGYRMGDLARWRSDGSLEYIGRVDQQVKIRGFRVELGEVEAVLGGHPELVACAIVVQDRGGGDKLLAAFVVGRQPGERSPTALREWLGRRLPAHMIPNLFVWLEQLPLTPNGKVDRRSLTVPETAGGGAVGDNRQSVNLLELELIRVWRRLFQREDIGPRDNFSALGGHSLLAARLAAEIDKLLGCKLPIATLFQTPTVELLARRLTDDRWAPPWSSLVPLQPQGARAPLFMVHGWGGDVYCFVELAGLLPREQPVYGLQAVGLDGKRARHTSIEEMAAHYVKEITSFQPAGPVYLAGYSMGGMIAYETAQQLHRQGRRVGLLAMLDSNPSGIIPRFFYGLAMASYLPRRCGWHFRQWWKLPAAEKLRYVQGRWAALRYWLGRLRSQPGPVTVPPPLDSQPPQVPGFSDYYQAVARSYQLRPYPGKVEIFASDAAKSGWRWYWRHLARGGVSFHRVPGGHFDIMFSPDHRTSLAKSLTRVLQRAQEKEAAI